MSEGVRYHLRRGRVTGAVDQVHTEAVDPVRTEAVDQPRAQGTLDTIPRIATGSVSDMKPLGLDDDELGELAVPVVERAAMAFGAVDLVIEHHGDRVALVLPGMVRLIGSAHEARALAALLLTRKQRR